MELDRVDVEILRALQEDARRSHRELARRTGVSVPTVSARIARLEELGVLDGYHAGVNPMALGQIPVFLVLKCKPARAEAVGTALAAFPEVRWVSHARGSRVVAEAVVEREDQVDDLLKRVEALGDILDYEAHVATQRVKDTPLAVLHDHLSTKLLCFQCGKVIDGEPIRLRLDGRDHYVCCESCRQLYLERYGRIKAGASAKPSPKHEGHGGGSRP